MPKVRIDITGDKEVARHLAFAPEKAVPAAKKALLRFADSLVPKIRRDTPVDPADGGQLRRSVRRTRATFLRRRPSVTVSLVAGGKVLERMIPADENPIYAITQHEDTSIRHTTGRPKFIEIHVFGEADRGRRELEDAVLRAID